MNPNDSGVGGLNSTGESTKIDDLENDDLENELLDSSDGEDVPGPSAKKQKLMEKPTKEVKQVETVPETGAERQQSNQSEFIELIHTSEKPAFQTLKCTFKTCERVFKSNLRQNGPCQIKPSS